MNRKILIFEVYKREAIWKKNHPMHNNIGILDKLWDDIAQVMGISNAQARKKWKHLKDSFRRELRKEINSKLENRECPYVSNWAYYNSLLFLKTEVIPNARKQSLEELTWTPNETVKLEDFAPEGTFQYEVVQQGFKENDDYHFFMSLVPHLQQFDTIQKLRIRNKIQQIIIDEATAATSQETMGEEGGIDKEEMDALEL